MIKHYRKKPVVIEAALVPTYAPNKVTEFLDTVVEIINWCGGKSFMMDPPPDKQEGIHIETLEGTMVANPGDYIIKGVKGEFYPCKPDIFEATYEAINTPIGGIDT